MIWLEVTISSSLHRDRLVPAVIERWVPKDAACAFILVVNPTLESLVLGDHGRYARPSSRKQAAALTSTKSSLSCLCLWQSARWPLQRGAGDNGTCKG